MSCAIVLTSMMGLGCATLPTESSEPVARASLDATYSHTLNSEYVDQAFMIDVWVPLGASGELPVVYVLDGNSTFALAVQTAIPMIYAGELPPMMFVGIGYRVDNPVDAGVLRLRDMTPTESPEYLSRAASNLPVPEGLRSGGADAFLQFIEGELKPFISNRYPANDAEQTLVGFSLGGLFAMHVALSSPDAFDRYLAGSPYLDWDEGHLFQVEAARAQEAEAWAVRLFLSAGALETGILETYKRMAPKLAHRGYEGLELSTHVFPNETHTSVLGATISRGLRELFE